MMSTVPVATRNAVLIIFLISTLVGTQACADDGSGHMQIATTRYHLEPTIQFKLPKVIREVSGLALDESDRLFAHNDEVGIIYQIDYDEGRIIQRFAFAGGVKGDFEGIAVAGDQLFLVSSKGTIYTSRIGQAEEMVSYQRHEGDVDCEVEGLTFEPDSNSLLVACKNLEVPDDETAIRLLRWRIDNQAYDPDASVTITRSAIRAISQPQGKKLKKIQPTGIDVAPNGNLVVVAGRQHLLLELTPKGEPVAAFRLEAARHRQTEGIAITSDHRLLLADEGDAKGNNKSRGTLSVYEPSE